MYRRTFADDAGTVGGAVYGAAGGGARAAAGRDPIPLEAGIPVRVMVAPVVPGITDHEVEAILEAARDAGASLASYIVLRLPGEVKDLFVDWLDTHYPARRNKVLNTIRSLRDGKLNNAEWGERMVGKGAFGKALDIRFAMASRRLGLKREGKALRTDLFVKPGRDERQMSLF